MQSSKDKKKKNRPAIAALIAGILLTAAITVLAARWMLSLRDPENLLRFQQKLNSMGPGGWFVLLGIQYVQIVIAFIPGGPIQMVAGALYGPWGGLSVCLLGTILATATVFRLVGRLGMRIISLFVDKKDVLRYRFLQDERRLEGLVVLLFFIPGTPKDALTYLFALTPIPFTRFLFLATMARIPAMLTSVLAGDSIVNGEWGKALIMFLIITMVTAAGFLLHRKIMRRLGKGKRDIP